MKETRLKISRNYIQAKLDETSEVDKDSDDSTNRENMDKDIFSLLCDNEDKVERKKWLNLGMYDDNTSFEIFCWCP
jgi:hypothetical protein